uniref:Filamin-C n=1 Tax=Lygus hesperus TaxID=30085 RepID=A0A0A9Z5I1_LYGHE
MEVIISLFYKIITATYGILTSIFVLLSRKKTLSNEKLEVLKWISESCGTEIRSLQQLWDTGPNTLGKYIEQLNNQDVTWWAMQDLVRSTYAVPQVMTRQEMGRRYLRGHAEKKFLRLLLRLKEALERSVGCNSLRVSGDLFAKGVALSAAYVGMRSVFFIYSYRNQLEGVQIEMTGPGNVKVETKLRRDGLMVGYTVDKSGMYILEISKNNWFVPGSPFQVNVQDPPPSYRGHFGSNLWDKPETPEYHMPTVTEQQSHSNTLQWETELDQSLRKPFQEAFPSRPKRKKETTKVSSEEVKQSKSKQQIVELSQIAAAIILARRFTNRMQSRIPELRVERPNDQQTELNLWSNLGGPTSLREITYVSPEGATFPISVSNRRDDHKPKKWNEHNNQSLEDWLLGRTSEFNRGNEPYLCLPEQDVFPRSRQSGVTFQRGSPNIVRPVRPFNHPSSNTASSGSETESMKRRADGRVWTHCTSIGVNTDESWTNSSPVTSGLKKEFKSLGVQVGASFSYSNSLDVNTFQYNHYEMKSALSQGDCKRLDHGLPLKEQSSQDSVLSRTKKCDTFNSDDTSSSVTTNYSEKVIEMDLKVHYETIALTSTDDEFSHSDSARRESLQKKRRSSSQDLLLPSIDGSSSSREYYGSNRGSSETTNNNPRELVKRQSVDGIYKATLMSIDNSPIKAGLPSVDGTTVNLDKTGNSAVPTSSHTTEVKYEEDRSEAEYKPTSYKDELLKLRLVYDSFNMPGDQNHMHYFCTTANRIEMVRQYDLARFETEDLPKINIQRIEQKRLKQLMKKRWTSKIPSRRVVKQGSGTCKRHLRKTLSLIPKMSKDDSGPRTSALYSFGPYPVKKDMVHIQTPVRAWKNFWDNIANRKETIIRRDCSIKNKGLVRKGKSALQKLSQGNTDLPDAAQDEDRKRR